MTSLTLDADAVLWSVPPADRATALASRPLLVLMHGRGSNENDLFSLAPLLPQDAVVASLRAPLPLGGGFSWFPTADPGLPSARSAGDATDAVLAWLDGVRPDTEQYAAAPPTWVLGFSQGGAMATQLMRLAAHRFSAYVNLSGFSIAGELPADTELGVSRPPVFWGRDPADPVIPPSAVERTDAWLAEHSSLTKREYRGVGHSISRDELDDVSAFLAARS